MTAETVFGEGALADKIQEALAQAWDEGHAEAQAKNGWNINLHDCPNNPYRSRQ